MKTRHLEIEATGMEIILNCTHLSQLLTFELKSVTQKCF